mgnify:FL=1
MRSIQCPRASSSVRDSTNPGPYSQDATLFAPERLTREAVAVGAALETAKREGIVSDRFDWKRRERNVPVVTSKTCQMMVLVTV